LSQIVVVALRLRRADQRERVAYGERSTDRKHQPGEQVFSQEHRCIIARAMVLSQAGRPGRARVLDVSAGEIAERCEPGNEPEVDRAGGAGTVLGDDDLGHALGLAARVVDLVAVQEHHDVGVLLNRA